MKKICVVTATRAEYGLLKPVIELIEQSDILELQLLVTGTHLSPEFGLTYQEIEKNSHLITAKIEMLMSSDTAVGITKSMGSFLFGLADFYELNKPDMVVILGDRYEMLMVASAAMVAKIPIAHIGGGEITEGAYDDAIRHSITKMSSLHFASTERYRERIIQMGEQPKKVYNVGALGVENIKKVLLWSKEKLEENLQFPFGEKMIVVTYHPVTLDYTPSEIQFRNLLHVLDKHKDINVIFTKANADTNGRVINKMIDEYVEKNKKRCIAFSSLGQIRYLSTLQFCKAVVGNSSSGIIEAPSFHIPTVNIGNRQKGRISAKTVLHCGFESIEIEKNLIKALSDEFQKQCKSWSNPYEGNNTSQFIVKKLEDELEHGIEVKKTFFDMRLNI